MKSSQITVRIMIALVLGAVVGAVVHNQFDADGAKEIAGYLSLLTDVFLHLIKMIIAPLVFATVVSGIANTGDTKTVGRIGVRALGWFIIASLISLTIGLVMASVLKPGEGMQMTLPAADASSGITAHALNLKDFLAAVFPTSVFDAMAKNNILQILVFAVFFGFALAALGDKVAKAAIDLMHEMVPVMLRVTNYVMWFAPFGVFGAVSAAVSTEGVEVFAAYGRYLSGFYLALGILWVLMILVGSFFLPGGRIFKLVRMLREPMLLAFSTSTSEAAYPGAMMQLGRFGVNERIAGLVLPLGYSFNLTGSMINMTFASLFISQIYGIDLSLTQKITMLLVLMISSKGIAGVPRASLVVVAAVLPIFHLPDAGLLLILGVDHFLDMGRSATNVLGNCIATAVIAKWEGDLGEINEEVAA